MPTLIKTFSDGSTIEYDAGSFDSWCVYLTCPGKARYAPKDVQYFERLQVLAHAHGNRVMYADFLSVFDKTTKELDRNVLNLISKLSKKYQHDALEVDLLLSIVYAGMVAEENKKYTRLGKKVKRLGMHQVLLENMNSHAAANFSKGKSWREILQEYNKRIAE